MYELLRMIVKLRLPSKRYMSFKMTKHCFNTGNLCRNDLRRRRYNFMTFWCARYHKIALGDGLYKLVQSVHLYVIVFLNRYCLNRNYIDLVKTMCACWIERERDKKTHSTSHISEKHI